MRRKSCWRRSEWRQTDRCPSPSSGLTALFGARSISVRGEPVEPRLSSISTALGQFRQQIPVPVNQRLLLGSRPALDPLFRLQCLVASREIIRPDQLHRSPFVSISREKTALMLGKALFQIIGMTRVKAGVRTLQYLGVTGHDCVLALRRPSTSSGLTEFEIASQFCRERAGRTPSPPLTSPINVTT